MVTTRLAREGYDPVVPRLGFFGRHGGLVSGVSLRSEWSVSSADFNPFTSEASPWSVWEGDGLVTKGYQQIELKRRDERCVVVNTHLQSEYGDLERPGRYTGIRLAQIEQLVGAVSVFEGLIDTIVSGDFNVHPAEVLLYDAMRRRGITDLTQALRAHCRCGTFHSSPHRKLWIDYVLARGAGGAPAADRATLICNRGPDEPYSDHDGLDVSISFPAKSARTAVDRVERALMSRRHCLSALVRLIRL